MSISKTPIAKLWQNLSKNLNFIKVVLTVLLIFIPLHLKFPLQEVSGIHVAIRLEDLLVSASLAIWFIWQAQRHFPIFKEKIFKLFLIYWLIGLISLASAFFITGLISPKIAFLHFFRRVEYMSLFFIAYDAFKHFKLKEFNLVFVLVSFGVFAYGVGQKYFGLPVVSTMNKEFSSGILLYLDKWTRISSTFAGHYDLAAWVAIMLALVPALIMVAKKKRVKFFLALAGAANFYMLIMTASRISFIAYLIGITLTLLLLKKFRWLPMILGLSLVFGFCSKELRVRLASSFEFISPVAQRCEQEIAGFLSRRQPTLSPTPKPKPTPILASTPTSTPAPKTTVKKQVAAPPKRKIIKEVRTWPTPEEVGAAADRSSQIRFQVEWPRAIKAFLKNPLLGTGYSSLGLATDNDYLRTLGETGILGFLAFGLIIFHLFRSGLEALIKNKRLILAGFLGATLAFLANAIFIDVFEASKDAFCFWMMMGIMYRLSLKPKNDS